ncbi:MAG TPA: rhodanese-like domain-containing protein [Vicinamibacterales bacterium]|jgi:hydroxyacylglutathione hydrolase
MFLRRFFEPTIAQTSYLIGCADAGEAIVIDPNRDVEPYIAAAKAEGAKITYVTETHIHADFVSGTRELAARTGATMLLSGEGDTDWQYAFAHETGARIVRHGDHVDVGNVRIDVLHTPGHTPEHLTFLVTDRATTDEPIGAATGDFLFVGDVGRPDLLEKAAHVAGTMETGAKSLYASLQAFAPKPDYLQIWPGHGAGSACGKGISAIPQSTLGYEKRFNWAFRAGSEDAFVRAVLSGQPDPPKYFAHMKHMNKDGPPVLGAWPQPPQLGGDHPETLVAELLRTGEPVIDTRRADEFGVGHIPGTVNIPLNGSFTNWAGWLLPYDRDITLIVSSPGAMDTAVRYLALIGIDRVRGYVTADVVDAWSRTHGPLNTIARIGVDDLAESLKHRGVTLVDVRNDGEWTGVGHIDGAIHVPLGHLVDELARIPRERPVVVQCQGGSRSAIGASLLRASGYQHVINFSPGIAGWIKEGKPVVGEGPHHS